ncbi:MAG: DUF4198 domain-containing protein [Archaeoglobaceae archaeon]
MRKRKKCITIFLALCMFLLLCVGTASAHFAMVFPGGDMQVTPEDYIAEKGETKDIIIVWGHPYEHILFDCPNEPDVSVTKPDGSTVELTPSEITVQEYKAYEVSYTVDQMGDHIIDVRLDAGGEHGLMDYTKAVIHSGEEVWTGWDAEVGQKAEIMPYMRPYGMEEGFVFSGKALYEGEALAGATVEIEEYHTKEAGEEVVSKAEEKYPYDPPMVFTRVAKTNAGGDFSYTLDEPGIWFVGATKEIEDGMDQRGVFIIPLIEEFPPEETAESNGNSDSGTTSDIEDLKTSMDDLQSNVQSLQSKVEGMETGGTSSLTYAAMGIAIVAIIVAAVSMTMRR